MATLAPINLIEISEEYGDEVARIAGTRIRVSEIVIMHLRNNSPVDWIVENFEVLNHAQVYAALAYYYEHQSEIDSELDTPLHYQDGSTLEALQEKIRLRQDS